MIYSHTFLKVEKTRYNHKLVEKVNTGNVA